jgi:hypothetical protein
MAGANPSNWESLVEKRLPTFVHGFDALKKKTVKLVDLVKRRARELHMFTAPRCPCDGVAQ